MAAEASIRLRILKAGLAAMSMVIADAAEASIRLRILKDDQHRLKRWRSYCGRGFDPTEGTERRQMREPGGGEDGAFNPYPFYRDGRPTHASSSRGRSVITVRLSPRSGLLNTTICSKLRLLRFQFVVKLQRWGASSTHLQHN